MRAEVQILGREPVAEGTLAFYLAKPADFRFRAGQAVNVELPEPPPEPNSTRRVFSIASAPHEETLTIATRMRDASPFKHALGKLPDGSRLKLRGPLGTMTLHAEAHRPAVFIAGGIGITPFLSMIRHALHERLAHDIYLLYSNRRPKDAAFLEELKEAAKNHPRFRLLARMTDQEGFLDEAAVRRFTADAARPMFYLAGPPAMVTGMNGVVRGMGVPAHDVISEEFYGY